MCKCSSFVAVPADADTPVFCANPNKYFLGGVSNLLPISSFFFFFFFFFLSVCRPFPLFLSRIDPAAANIFTYLKIFFVLETGAPGNFGPNL